MPRRPDAETVLGTVVLVLVGLLIAMAAAHWAVCEQEDRLCAFTGQPSQ